MKPTILVLGIFTAAFAFGQHPIRVKVEEHAVNFDAAPRDVRGVTMVPIRSMVDAMGGTMRWDLAKQVVSVWKQGKRYDIVLNSRSAVVNDKPVVMEEASMIHKNRIFVPLKFVADASGYVISMEDGWFVLRPNRK